MLEFNCDQELETLLNNVPTKSSSLGGKIIQGWLFALTMGPSQISGNIFCFRVKALEFEQVR